MSGFQITSSPFVALTGGALLAGVEREEGGDLRLYVGARYRGVYARVPAGAKADAIERLWEASAHGHLFVSPAPPLDTLHREEARA